MSEALAGGVVAGVVSEELGVQLRKVQHADDKARHAPFASVPDELCCNRKCSETYTAAGPPQAGIKPFVHSLDDADLDEAEREFFPEEIVVANVGLPECAEV